MPSLMLDRDTLRQPIFIIEINGESLPYAQHERIIEVEVEDDDTQLDIARITIEDVDRWFVNNSNIIKGSEIKVYLGHIGHYRLMLDGKITVVEVDFKSNGVPTIIIGAVDEGVDIVFSKKDPFTWENAKVSDAVKEIVAEYGFTCLVEDTKIPFTFSRVEGESDYAFIQKWADDYGFVFHKIGEKLYYFGSRQYEQEAEILLEYYQGECSVIDFNFQWVTEEKDSSTTASDISEKGNEETETKTNTDVPKTPTDSTFLGTTISYDDGSVNNEVMPVDRMPR